MKYAGLPLGMWVLFKRSFQNNLVTILDFDPKKAAEITRKAKYKYREIISGLPEFEKGDRFVTNIVGSAFFAAFYLNMEPKPALEKVTEYYSKAMMTGTMKWFCRQSGKNKFTAEDIQALRETASFKAADRNPYSWNMELYEYADGSGYEARFTKCGICTLMKELGIYDAVPAMCQLDYTMSEAGASPFLSESIPWPPAAPTATADIRKGRTSSDSQENRAMKRGCIKTVGRFDTASYAGI